MPEYQMTMPVGCLDLDLLPAQAHGIGRPEFALAASQFLEREFERIGGNATALVDKRNVVVRWRIDRKDRKPGGLIVDEIEAGRFREGQVLLRLWMSRLWDNADSLLELGAAMSGLGSMYQAEGFLKENRERADRAVRFLTQAEVYLWHALVLCPENLAVQIALGSTFLRLGKVDEAATLLSAVLARTPAIAKAQKYWGMALLAQDRRAFAVWRLRKSAELDPRDQETWLALGEALTTLGKFTEARAALKLAIKFDPTGELAGMAKEALVVNSGLAMLLHKANRMDTTKPRP